MRELIILMRAIEKESKGEKRGKFVAKGKRFNNARR